MDYLIDFWNWLNINKDVLSSIGSIATAITVAVLSYTVIINRRQLSSQEQELAVVNYTTIFKQFDHPTSKASRRVLYRSHNYICKLEQKYDDKDSDEVLDSVNEIAKHMVGVYDSIYFLVKDNEKLKQKLILHHGFTMGRLWKILQGLHQTWKNKDFVLDYVGFKELGTKSYEKNKEKVDIFFEKNYKVARELDPKEIIHVKNEILGFN